MQLSDFIIWWLRIVMDVVQDFNLKFCELIFAQSKIEIADHAVTVDD